MRPANVRDFALRDLKLQVYICCPDKIYHDWRLDTALKAALPDIRKQLAEGKKKDRVVLKNFPGKPEVSWVVHPLWWSDTPDWSKAPYPWDNPFLGRT